MTRADRRKAPRIETDLSGILDKHATEEARCRVANLSRSGALAVSNRALPEMSQVRVRIQVADESTGDPVSFHCEAAVVRCDRRPDANYDLGLFFTAMKEEDRMVLENLLRTKPVVPVS